MQKKNNSLLETDVRNDLHVSSPKSRKIEIETPKKTTFDQSQDSAFKKYGKKKKYEIRISNENSFGKIVKSPSREPFFK
jgi:hypothetical protein